MRITKLDGLRGIFSLMIILFHYDKQYLPNYLDNFLINNSYVFVDFFFVLSGFVISYNYNSMSNYNSFFTYIKKRFIRLYPLHFYTNFLMLIYILVTRLFLVKLLPQYFESLEFSFDKNIKPFFDSILLTNSTPILGNTNGINYPSWSISSEIISYVVFGIICVFFSKKNKTIVSILLITISSYICFIFGDFFNGGDIGFLRGFVSFFLGFIIWKIYNKNKTFTVNKNLELLIPVVFIYLIFTLDKLDSTQQGLIFGIVSIPMFFSLSILLLLFSNGLLTKLLETRVFQFLGKVSFSVYLNHSLLLSILVKPIFRIVKPDLTDFNMLLVMIILIGFTLIYSYFTYSLIENKFGKYLRNKFLKI
jgi:peptidoglycan/LPS O-acetylase OafA/YrhL